MASATRHAPATLFALIVALLVAGSAAGQSIGDKRAEAQRVLAEIQEIDSNVARAAEAYNLANIELDRIAEEQRANGRLLVIARTNLGRANRTLEQRLVAIYTGSAQGGSALEVLLGASSFDDLLARLETVERVSDQDTHVLRQVTTFRRQVARRKTQLAHARSRQGEIVAQRADAKRQVEAQLAERQRLLGSIQSEIARLEAAERARQRAAEAQARARLAAQALAPPAPAVAAAVATETTPPFESTLVAPEPVAAPPSRYGGVVGIAMQYLGTPYVWGGSSPGGFDCSGFVMYVYSQVGVSLPHNAAAQFGYGTPVSRSDLQPGDIVFFDGLGHNGIYIGGDQFIHSPHTGDVVKISSLAEGWYDSGFVGARRL